MYVSSYLERLKMKLAALPLEGTLAVENGAEVLHAWADMQTGELTDRHKPIGRWLPITVPPYDEFCVWLTQHGVKAYYQEERGELFFVRVQSSHLSLDRLMPEIPLLYARQEQTIFVLIEELIRQSIVLMRCLREGGLGLALARLFSQIVLIAQRQGIDLATELFKQMVGDKVSMVEEPERVDLSPR